MTSRTSESKRMYAAVELGILLQNIWDDQMKYNDRVKSRYPQDTTVDWLNRYIAGAHEEASEIQKEMVWKRHRAHGPEGYSSNIREEVADLTKFVLSMWQEL